LTSSKFFDKRWRQEKNRVISKLDLTREVLGGVDGQIPLFKKRFRRSVSKPSTEKFPPKMLDGSDKS
jgi:hypothetical protein